MKVFYDASHQKQWNPDKFYMPEWMGPDSKFSTFIGGLDRTGFKVSLWLNCNDDLTMEEEREASPEDYVTVILPEFVPARWWQHLLHNQSARLIKGALLFRRNTVVTSVPFHLAG